MNGPGSRTEKTDKHGGTPLHWAYREGHHEVMGLLLDEGADKDKADDEGCTRCTMRMRQNWVI